MSPLDFVEQLIDLSLFDKQASKKPKHKREQKKLITFKEFTINPQVAAPVIDQHQKLINFLDFLGNPQHKFRTIHVSGTSGKGSTSTFISRILTHHKIKNGLFVSPYVFSPKEIFQINSQQINDDLFDLESSEYLKLADKWLNSYPNQQLTYHELLFAFSCRLFARQNVDVAVVECFMGGRFDSTNVFTRPDQICVVTSIGKDHLEYLGTSYLDAIWHKIGIVHKNNAVFVGPSITLNHKKKIRLLLENVTDKIFDVSFTLKPEKFEPNPRNLSDRKNTKFKLSDREVSWSLSLEQSFLLENFATAYQVCKHYLQSIGLAYNFSLLDQDKILSQIPGRLNIVNYPFKQKNLTIVFDGGHNEQKIRFLKKGLKNWNPKQKYICLFSCGKDKPLLPMLKILETICPQIVVSTFQVKVSDNRIIKESVVHLQKGAEQNSSSIIFERDPEKALKFALNQSHKSGLPILCTGSFYFIGLVKEYLS